MTDTDLVNQALAEIGQSPLVDLDPAQNNVTIDVALLQLPRIKEAVLASKDWNCVRKRAALAAVDNDSLGEWTYAYRVPPDCLVVRRFVSPDEYTRHAKFAIELDADNKRVLYTNCGSSSIVYTANITDVNKWQALLYDACATRLAAVFASALARDINLEARKLDIFRMKIDDACGVDESEGGIESVYSDDLVSVRY